MSTRAIEETDHKATSPVEGDERQKEVLPTTQPLTQPGRFNRIHLPEQELCRRLWRLYDMALAAANRAEQEPSQTASSTREKSCKK